MNPLDLVAAHPWKRAVFTTYALSLSFVEAVLLDALVRGGGQKLTIFSDPMGVRAGLSEHGAQRVGRDYEVEPVACRTGAFHPKLGVLVGTDDCHLLAGSGNLTFSGWGGNLEVIEHLHPSFAADAFDDAVDFFELIALSDSLVLGAREACAELADLIRAAASGPPRTGAIRLLHSLEGGIAEQAAAAADELGGATRLTVISPFFERPGSGLLRFAERLGHPEILVHAHPAGAVRGSPGTGWPTGANAAAVRVEEDYGGDSRPLHAKAFEILCRRGRLLLSGSANATVPGLFGSNVEASVLRVQREVSIGWENSPAEPLDEWLQLGSEEEDAVEARHGILRAVLDGDRIIGQVICPRIQGEAASSFLRAERLVPLGTVTIDPSGSFEIAAPGVEVESWLHGRLLVRLEQESGACAEGFVSLAAAAELIRRTGPLAPRLMAMMAGTETPEDVAVIFACFRENPHWIPADPRSIGGGAPVGGEARDVFVTLEDLRRPQLWSAASSQSEKAASEATWRRSLAMLLGAFRAPRGPWRPVAEVEAVDDEELPGADRLADEERRRRAEEEDERTRERIVRAFEDLLEVMLGSHHHGAQAGVALAIGNYLCDRLRPEPGMVRAWLSRILAAAPVASGGDGDRAFVAAALLHYGLSGSEHDSSRARRFLVRHGLATLPEPPDFGAVSAFRSILGPQWDPAPFERQVRIRSTPGEQAAAYLRAADAGGERRGFEGLKAFERWPQLERALDDPALRQRLLVVDKLPKSCPNCARHLARPVIEDLRNVGAAVARDCCSRTIICTEV